MWAPGYTRQNFMNPNHSPKHGRMGESPTSPNKRGVEDDTSFSQAAIRHIDMKKYAF